MAVTNPETLNALREIGCLVNDKVNTSAVTYWLALRLQEAHIATSLDQVPAVETTVGQLASAMVGQEDTDFIDVIRPLLSAGPAGKVQRALSNGYMLCSSRARVEINIEGETAYTVVGTRFLSADHDVLQQYVLDPRLKRADSFVNSSLALRDLVALRQPDMAPKLGTFIERLNISWQRALEPGQS